MSWSRIKGVLIQELYITKHESAIWFDLMVMSTMSVLVFGFLSRYLSAHSDPTAGLYVILGMILWEVVRVNQYCISVNSMWNLWSHNLSNIFVAPISLAEYIIGNCLLAIIKTSVVIVAIAVIARLAFDFNLLVLGWTLPVTIVILTFFAWGVGWFLLGFIFRYGTTVQAVAWGAIFFVQPVSAVYFPVRVVPTWLQDIGWAFPSTYGFEASRRAIAGQGTSWHLLVGGLLLDVVWFALGIKGFAWLFHRSRVVGQFARNDS